MSTVIDLRQADDARDIVHRAVLLLTSGELVGFPTETVYVACASALAPAGLRKLIDWKASTAARAALVVKGLQQAIDYLPSMSRLGRKLSRRCWPGPVTLAFDVAEEQGLLAELPAEAQGELAPDGQLWLQVPAHSCIQEVMRLMPVPLVTMIGKPGAGRPPLITAQQMVDSGSESLSMVIDDGECRYAEPATVVRVTDREWSVLERGVVTETMIGRLASEVFLFICTGNTCRSPLAEGFFRKMLADRLKCGEDELSDRGFTVFSAGLAAERGMPASPDSVEVAKSFGVDLRSHESQPVTDRLLDQADRIFAMTRAHREAVLASRPELAERIELLSREHRDVPDPMGGTKEDYEQAGAEIERNLRAVLDAMSLP